MANSLPPAEGDTRNQAAQSKERGEIRRPVVFYEVGEKTTTVSRRTILLKYASPKLGGKWDSDARVWRMPVARTPESRGRVRGEAVQAAEVGTGIFLTS
jgi:hypothetical protein